MFLIVLSHIKQMPCYMLNRFLFAAQIPSNGKQTCLSNRFLCIKGLPYPTQILEMTNTSAVVCEFFFLSNPNQLSAYTQNFNLIGSYI